MKLLIDENLPPRLATWLSESGHDAVHIRECLGHGCNDNDIANLAVAEDRVIVTKNADFATPRNRERVLHLRVNNCSAIELLAWLAPRLAGAIQRLATHEVYVELD